MLHVPYQGDGKIDAGHARLRREAAEGDGDPDARARLGRQVRHRPPAPVHAGVARRPRRTWSRVLQIGEAPAVARSTATSAPSTTSARSSPRSAARPRRPSTTACCAHEIEERMRAGKGPMTPDGDDRRGEVPPGRRRPAQLDQLPRVLEDVLRRGRGRRRSHLRQGRRPLRLRLPPRPGPPARVARRVLPRLLHQPQPAVAHRHDLHATSTSTRPTAC